jgi:protein pelota
MKVLKKQISAKDGSGIVVLRPETPEDLWHCYNLLQTGDMIRTTTLRKVVKESSTGSTSSQKKRMNLTIQVQKVDFDPQSLELRLSGPTTSESDLVKMGAFHTLKLELDQNFSLEKECWDQIFLDRIQEACDPERQAEIAAVVMQGSGLAHVCVVTGSITITKARIDVNIPKKRTGSSAHAKAIDKFYNGVYQAILKLPWEQLKVCMIGSPGFVKDDFYKYIVKESIRREDRVLIENKHKFLLAKASSGHKHALDEVFADPQIMAQIEDTKVAKEVAVIGQFMRMIDTDPERAYYGYAHVQKAQESLAIDSLLVADQLFRADNIQTRRKYVDLVEDVRESGGKVYIFSSMHVSGQQLMQVSGLAAILRYPLPDIEDAVEQDLSDNEVADEDDEERDPEKRVREDLQDMGL